MEEQHISSSQEVEVEDHDNGASVLMMDDLGEETVSPLPLLLDQTSEELLPRSEAPLVELPSEVLGEIVRYLEPTSLASFALVNKECRQLARSRQFARVVFADRSVSFQLISKLLCEFSERLLSPTHTTSRLSIGACIRHITVATSTGLLFHDDAINFARVVNTDKRMSRDRAAHAITYLSRCFNDLGTTGHTCSNVFYGCLNTLGTVLGFREVLPHLESLEIIEDKFGFKWKWAGPCSSEEHLKVGRVKIDEEFKMSDMRPSDGHWALQVLHMDVNWILYGERNGRSWSRLSLCSSILQLCFWTLTLVTWDNVSGHSLAADFQNQLKFPGLRELRLGRNVIFSDSKYLDALIGANLVLLVADIEKTDIHLQVFQKRGTILSLETFVWRSSLESEKCLDFLRANPQLFKLSLPDSSPPQFLEERLLPLLSSSFKNLGSLSLVWNAHEIPNSALEIISTLRSLEQIHLSCDHRRRNWMIDHKSIRRYLRLLPHLKKVAFSRDEYDIGIKYLVKSSPYFGYSYLSDAEVDKRNKVWEEAHRDRMLDEATEYVRQLPQLEWLYLGQLPMAVRAFQTPMSASWAINHVERCAVPLSAERDIFNELLRKIFDAAAN